MANYLCESHLQLCIMIILLRVQETHVKTLSNADMLHVCQWFYKCPSGMAHLIVILFQGETEQLSKCQN